MPAFLRSLPGPVEGLAQPLDPFQRREILVFRVRVGGGRAFEHVQPLDHPFGVRQELLCVLVGGAAGQSFVLQHPGKLVRGQGTEAGKLNRHVAERPHFGQCFREIVRVVAVVANRVELCGDSFLFHAKKPTMPSIPLSSRVTHRRTAIRFSPMLLPPAVPCYYMRRETGELRARRGPGITITRSTACSSSKTCHKRSSRGN